LQPAAEQLAIGHRAARIGFNANHAVFHDQITHLRAQALGGTINEHAAGTGRSTAQFRAALKDRQIAGCQPLIWGCRGIAHDHLDLIEGHIEFFSGHLRKRGAGAGAEIDFA